MLIPNFMFYYKEGGREEIRGRTVDDASVVAKHLLL